MSRSTQFIIIYTCTYIDTRLLLLKFTAEAQVNEQEYNQDSERAHSRIVFILHSFALFLKGAKDRRRWAILTWDHYHLYKLRYMSHFVAPYYHWLKYSRGDLATFIWHADTSKGISIWLCWDRNSGPHAC